MNESNTLYRYEALLQAIDFFTQRFDTDQIGYYAFEFTNEILTLNSSALFVYESQKYVLKQKRLYEIGHYEIDATQTLLDIPVLHGDIIYHQMNTFFSKEFIDTFDIKLVIPLIINDFLYGFIITNGKMMSSLEEDDWNIARTLTKLFKSSLENSKQLNELSKKNKQLDQKIFNLFAINQSAKSLLYEVDISHLYSLATDVFSEITCSKVTSFGIYDNVSQSIKVLGYRNITTYSSVFTEFYLHNRTYSDIKVVLDLHNDIGKVKSIFKNWEDFSLLEARYIILLVKEELLGIVTISESINDNSYDEATFELIESLASFTHIAITNALLFKELAMEQQRTERKFNTLDTLNKIMQNINSATSIQELSKLTLKVLSLNFGIKKAFFAYGSDNEYTALHVLGADIQEKTFTLNNNWHKAYENELILDFSKDAIFNYFDLEFINQIGTSNCIVIAPIITSSTKQIHPTITGFLVVLEAYDSLKEEEILLIETIVKNITPIIRQMNIIQKLQEEYILDPLISFRKAVEIKLNERELYSLDFFLYYKRDIDDPLKKNCLTSTDDNMYFRVNGFIFLLCYEKIEDSSFCEVPYFDSLEKLDNFDFNGFYDSFTAL